MTSSLARFVKNESAEAPIEYILIAAGIAIALLTTVNTFRGTLAAMF
jgi:Flp pilus assembly pilin Flp